MYRRPRTCSLLHVGGSYFRNKVENRSLRRCSAFRFRGRTFLWQNQTEPGVNASRLSRTYFASAADTVQVHDPGDACGTSIHQAVTSRLPRFVFNTSRLWVAFLEHARKQQNREDHGTQDSGREPPRVSIESSHHIICAG